MRRYLPLLIAGSALIAAACRDTIAPKRSTTAADVVLSKLGGGPRSYATTWDPSMEDSAQTLVFTINPTADSTRIGDFRLVYEANSVCDPATSGYGAETWQNSCETLNEPITITAKFWWHAGQAYADFSPNIRFAPDKNVYLWLLRPEATGPMADWMNYDIWYTTVIDGMRYYVDEAYNDPSLATHVEENGQVWRRIKHFSGYNVFRGEPCDDTAGDPDCVSM